MSGNRKIIGFMTAAFVAALGTVACVQATSENGSSAPKVVEESLVQDAKVQATGVPVDEKGWKEEPVIRDLRNPWGMQFLPDGKMLVTMLSGSLLKIDPKTGERIEITGLPEVTAIGQGGLMDVSLHPKFAENGWVYLTLAQGNGQGNHSVLARGKLVGNNLEGTQVIFTPNFKKPGGQHFGSRILWLPDGTLLMSLGDGGNPPNSMNGKFTRYYVQDMDSDLGKLLRLDENGKPPKDNPFVGQAGAMPEIFTLGHRNIQGLARDPISGRIYANEHGANGGDEINHIEKGKNYGWPKATFSREYSGPKITDDTSLPGMVDPLVAWTPCPAPSGLAIYTGDKMPNWKGDLFSGGLAGRDVRRIDLDKNGKVLGMTHMDMKERVRDVRMGPDGYLWVMLEGANGRISRIIPE